MSVYVYESHLGGLYTSDDYIRMTNYIVSNVVTVIMKLAHLTRLRNFSGVMQIISMSIRGMVDIALI